MIRQVNREWSDPETGTRRKLCGESINSALSHPPGSGDFPHRIEHQNHLLEGWEGRRLARGAFLGAMVHL